MNLEATFTLNGTFSGSPTGDADVFSVKKVASR